MVIYLSENVAITLCYFKKPLRFHKYLTFKRLEMNSLRLSNWRFTYQQQS